MSAYITSVGSYLPGEPIGNDEIETYLGGSTRSDRLRRRMLEANGIEKRHYAIDRQGQTLMLNEGRSSSRSTSTVTTIMVMSDATLPLAEVKKRLSEMVDRVEHHHERVVVTRRGRPAAVLLSPDDLESLEETLDVLSTPGALEEIQRAQHEIDSGESVSADELREKFLKE